MPIAKAEIELVYSMARKVVDPALLEMEDVPWWRDFWAGYLMGFINGMSRGELERDPSFAKLNDDAGATDPQIFQRLGWHAGTADYADFMQKDDRTLARLVEGVANAVTHNKHWERMHETPEWRAHEERAQQWDEDFDTNIVPALSAEMQVEDNAPIDLNDLRARARRDKKDNRP